MFLQTVTRFLFDATTSRTAKNNNFWTNHGIEKSRADIQIRGSDGAFGTKRVFGETKHTMLLWAAHCRQESANRVTYSL